MIQTEKPILRPCLSEAKREELKRFKAKAVEIERRLSERNISSVRGTASPIKGDHVPNLSQLHRKYVDDVEGCSGQSDVDADHENFLTSISEWDISSIPPFDLESVHLNNVSTFFLLISFDTLPDPLDPIKQHLATSDLPSEMLGSTVAISQPPAICRSHVTPHQSRNIILPQVGDCFDLMDNGAISLRSGATEMNDYPVNVNDEGGAAGQSIEDTFVPSPPSTLIRSDSFIVDEPSECFLKQLEYSGVVVPSLTASSSKTEISQTNVCVNATEKRKPEAKKNMNSKLKKYPAKTFPFKKNRIPSGNISNLPEKLIRKCQNNSVNVAGQQKGTPKQQASVMGNQSRKPSASMESTLTQTDHNYECCNDASSIDERVAEIIASIEEKFHNEIALFLEKQKREQDAFLRKLMSQVKVKQEAFQCNLVMQLKALIGEGVSTLLKNQDNLAVLNRTTSNVLNDVNGNLSLSEATRSNDCQQSEVKMCGFF